MKNSLALFLLLIFTSCVKDQNKRKDAFDFIPENTSFVLKVNNLERIKSDMSNELVQSFTKLPKIKSVLKSLKVLDYLNTENDVLIAMGNLEANDNLNFTIVTVLKDSLLFDDTLNIKTIASSLYKKHTIVRRDIIDDSLFSTTIDSFFIASNHKPIIELLINNKTKNRTFDDFKNASTESALSLFNKSEPKENKAQDSLGSNIKLFGSLLNLDVDISQNEITLNGVTKAKDSMPNFIGYSMYSKPQQNKLAGIIPNNCSGFLSYTFDNYNTIKNNFKAITKLQGSSEGAEIADLIHEIGSFELSGNLVYALRSIDISSAKENFNSALSENFRQTDIYEFDSVDEIAAVFSPLIQFNNKNSIYFVLDDFIVFTQSIVDAKTIISNYNNQTTLINLPAYNTIKEQMSDEASLLFFSTSNKLDTLIIENLPDYLSEELHDLDLKKFNVKAFQIINDHGFAHVNAVIQKFKAKAVPNSISEEFTTVLEADLLNEAQLVKNHITGQKDILVQDINNTVYLISNRGKILWKKKLNGNILGKVVQLDIYKNGRLQLAFATPNRVYVIDRNGKDVSPFPMKFNDKITQPLSVFDYDNKKQYRLFVVQGKNTLMYDTKGKTVKGFTFKTAANNIKTQPTHFRVGNKDYIVFGAGKKMYALDRRGQNRLNIRDTIDFSNNEIYLYKNLFTTTNSSGQLVQVNQKGKVSKQNLLLPKDHALTTTSKTLVTLADNKLTIKSKSVELDFGDYTQPKIFYLHDKIYVSVTDRQAQKIYLFDSQAKLLPNFPVYGTSSIELDNIDKGKNLEFVVKGENNAVVVYMLN